MEALEEALCSHSSEYNNCNGEYFMQPAAVAKGKRTKRRRSHQRLVESIAIVGDSSSTSSAELEGSITEEDEDMAICLMLLARGHTADSEPEPEALREEAGGASTEKFTTRRVAEASTTTSVYECKTCNKCFPSFQALGGHRASHKKPKLTTVKEIAAAEEKKATIHDDMLQLSVNSFSKPVVGSEQSTNSKAKIHECSICGSEFSSGQALGGHMRRHRATAVNPESQESKKERSLILLSLDLNLPAPAEDESVYVDTQRPPPPAYAFTGQARPLIFAASASALVDCHY